MLLAARGGALKVKISQFFVKNPFSALKPVSPILPAARGLKLPSPPNRFSPIFFAARGSSPRVPLQYVLHKNAYKRKKTKNKNKLEKYQFKHTNTILPSRREVRCTRPHHETQSTLPSW